MESKIIELQLVDTTRVTVNRTEKWFYSDNVEKWVVSCQVATGYGMVCGEIDEERNVDFMVPASGMQYRFIAFNASCDLAFAEVMQLPYEDYEL